jgi:YebC/PmpR family DNA-binding regulatory protein
MSGHSHWAKIKRAKASTDARRGRVWSKLARRIIVAAKTGGGKPEENLQLRYAIDEAKAANMPNDTISNAIKKGTGELGVAVYEEVLYEGYASGGVAVMCESLTDNRNRTAPELRRIFEKSGGQLGNTGCVAWMFSKKGTFVVEADKATEDKLMEVALEAGADDVVRDEDAFLVTCETNCYRDVKAALEQAGIPVTSAEISQVPNNTVTIGEPEVAQRILRLMDELDSHDDVQSVYANFDIDESVMAKIEA